MDIKLPQEFVLRREVYAIQLFGRNLLEPIPPNAVILAVGRSTHARMIEVVWQEKLYIVFERDLRERMEPLAKPEDEDPAGSPCPKPDGYALDSLGGE